MQSESSRRAQRALVFLLFVVAISHTLLAQSGSPIQLQYTAPLHPGDVLTLTGKQRFNEGQLRNIRFHIGPVRVAAEVVSTETVRLVVPALPAGRYEVAVIKHERNRGKDIDQFRESIHIVTAPDIVVASAAGVLGTSGGSLSAGGATVALLVNGTSADVSLRIDRVRSELEAASLRDALRESESPGRLPVLVQDEVIVVTTADDLPEFLGLRVTASGFAATLPVGFEPELYAFRWITGADGEEIAQYEPLGASLDPATETLIAPLPSVFFEQESPSTTSGTRTATMATQIKQVTVLISVRTIRAPSCFEGQVTQPAGPTTTTRPSGTIALEARLDFETPQLLLDPTIYGPVLRDAFGPRHDAVDLLSADGDPVFAAGGGIVADTGFHMSSKKNRFGGQQGAGNFIILSHDDGTMTSYSHLLDGTTLVGNGEIVSPGQQIAQADSSGGVTGPHLHFKYRVCGTAINPWPFLRATGPDASEFLREFYVVAAIDGNVIPSTKQVVSSDDFRYTTQIPLTSFNFPAPSTHTLEIRVGDPSGPRHVVYKGQLKIEKPAGAKFEAEWSWPQNEVVVPYVFTPNNSAGGFCVTYWFPPPGTSLLGCTIPGATMTQAPLGPGSVTFSMDTLPTTTNWLGFGADVSAWLDHTPAPTDITFVIRVDGQEVFRTVKQIDNQNPAVLTHYPLP